ncbi:hypothetical protein WMF04_17340 [Sorangium sp. So ce260]
MMLGLERSPGSIAPCKAIPAAQVTASFHVAARRLVFAPVTSRVWMGTPR